MCAMMRQGAVRGRRESGHSKVDGTRVISGVSTDLYTSHFGLAERPFKLVPDPDFIFWSKAHRRAFSVLEYGLMTGAPLTVVTGEVGTGKTTLVQALLTSIDVQFTVGLISNAQGGRGDLLRWVLSALDIPSEPDAEYVSLFNAFQDFVVSEYAAGRQVLLIIDEAQNLTAEALEELRMLTNINSNKDELLQLVLLGQPELQEIITRPELRQFAQRVSATYHLNPMDTLTTHAYIAHRLRHAGGTGEEFTSQAIQYIFAHSQGIPRMVNKVCDLALVYAASAGADVVDVDVIEELMNDGIIIPLDQPPFFLTERKDLEETES